jgi:hypothetical protein
MMKVSAPLLVASLLASTASAQSVDQDARCLVASSVFVRAEQDANKRQVALAVRYFYLGRIDARGGSGPIKPVLDAQAKAITPANVGPIMTGCARSMQSKEAALRTLAGGGGK